jgi:hypothetical protein
MKRITPEVIRFSILTPVELAATRIAKECAYWDFGLGNLIVRSFVLFGSTKVTRPALT